MAGHVYIQHGHGTAGPFRTERAETREAWTRRKAPAAGVIVCRFLVRYAGRWHRLYSDTRTRDALPHFIIHAGERLAISGVSP